MIAFFMSKAGQYVLGALAALALLWGAYTYVDHQGYHRAAVEYQARIDKIRTDLATAKITEIERQDAANSIAKAREAERIAQLDRQTIELENLREEQTNAASQDTDRDEPALGAPGVQRINKFR